MNKNLYHLKNKTDGEFFPYVHIDGIIDDDGNIIDLATQEELNSNTAAIGAINDPNTGILKAANNYTDANMNNLTVGLISHTADTNNPHKVTAEQVGLGNVPNLDTNDQMPTYTVEENNTPLSSGEKLSTAFGKIAKAINSLIDHLANKANPHEVTAEQTSATDTKYLGFGNVQEFIDIASDRLTNISINITSHEHEISQIEGLQSVLDTIPDPNGFVSRDMFNATISDYVKAENLPTELPASDVHEWAKAENKPVYTADEVGADVSGSADSALASAKAYVDEQLASFEGGAPSEHNHDDRYYTEEEIDDKLSAITVGGGVTKDSIVDALGYTPYTPTEVDDKIEIEKTRAEAAELDLQNNKVPTTRKINGKELSSDITLSSTDVGADASGTASAAVNTHNTATDAHSDIRMLISELTTRLNTLADSDDETLDQLSEIVTYIKDNKTLIDSVTTGKVNTSDIIDNLTTDDANKPLSAAQGVAIKDLIDALQTEIDNIEIGTDLTDHINDTTIHITEAERTRWNSMTGSDTADYVAKTIAEVEAAIVSGEITEGMTVYVEENVSSGVVSADGSIEFTESETLEELVSGETLGESIGKLAKAVKTVGENVDKISEIETALDTLNEHDTTLPMTAVSAGSTEEEINEFYDNYSADMADDIHYSANVTHKIVHSILGSGRWYLEGHKTNSAHEYQSISRYDKNKGLKHFVRSKETDIWSPWKAIDIGNVLTASKNVYVDATNGDDTTGDGTQDKPWKTIQKAVNECPTVMPNSIMYAINIADGTYSEEIKISGKSKIALMFSDNEDGVVINGSMLTYYAENIWFYKNLKLNGRLLNSDNGNLVLANGTFNIDLINNPTYNGIQTNNASNIILNACTVNIYNATSGSGIISGLNGIITIDNATHVNINNCNSGLVAWGGNIKFNNPTLITFETVNYKFTESIGGKITFGNGGWQLIGSVTGANSVAIDSNLYTEFLVYQRCASPYILQTEYLIPSNKLTDTLDALQGGYYNSSSTYLFTEIAMSKTIITNNKLNYNGTAQIATTTMTVYGRRA